ncbi:MAG: hypothetical protein JEZ07_19750 [Phycisphaerae bacterium]|nr:hypothetical protein [Phycisphaerae bacterium]
MEMIKQVLFENDLVDSNYFPDAKVDSVSYFVKTESKALTFATRANMSNSATCHAPERIVELKLFAYDNHVVAQIYMHQLLLVATTFFASILVGIFPLFYECIFRPERLNVGGIIMGCICFLFFSIPCVIIIKKYFSPALREVKILKSELEISCPTQK